MPSGMPTAVVAGLSGDAGKSLVALGLLRALVNRGWRVAPFKKGPDFIDAAWLGAAARAPGRNLDTYLMSREAILASVARAAATSDLALIEGNRGLFDGLDERGSHSTAALAKVLGAPVLQVVNAVKVTRTAAALLLGCRALDPDLPIAGVILNRVATRRQEDLIRRALADVSDIPVIGAIPRLDEQWLPSRHLGLVCADEHPQREAALERLAEVAEKYVDVDAVIAASGWTGETEQSPSSALATARDDGLRCAPPLLRTSPTAKIGVLRDAAFSFYYPENLEALEAAGAEIVTISPLADEDLPAIDALYAGGGFPEEHAPALSANAKLRAQLARAISEGLPVWAECGGLMYLSRSVRHGDGDYPMAGALPFSVEVFTRPQGHGYVSAQIDRANPFLDIGTTLRGHEFHYSRLVGPSALETVMTLGRGTGLGDGRDGMRVGNVVATYTHLHALGVPEWAPGLVRAAHAFRISAHSIGPVAQDASSAMKRSPDRPAVLPERSAQDSLLSDRSGMSGGRPQRLAAPGRTAQPTRFPSISSDGRRLS